MWIIIRKSDNAVVGTQQSISPEGLWDPDVFEVKEWHGLRPLIHDPEPDPEDDAHIPVESYDPTLDCPEYAADVRKRTDFSGLIGQIDDEIEWLNKAIPQIQQMPLDELRGVLRRLAMEQRATLKALKYVALRFEPRCVAQSPALKTRWTGKLEDQQTRKCA